MLFTRCPQCDTTFRITEEALRKAGGQVRCGRCARIFDAYRGLREDSEGATSEHVVLESTGGIDTGAAAREMMPRPSSADGAESDDARGARVQSGITPDEVEAILDETPADEEPEWLSDPEPKESGGRRGIVWTAASAGMLLLLAGQALHHYRAQLAVQPGIGPAIRGAYSVLGVELRPHWSAGDYDVLGSSAIAEPNANGRGNLIIRSRLQNAGTRQLPYPYVQLRLLDRWEKTIGSRVFGPSEYLTSSPSTPMMAAGASIDAEIVIVDPGPDASGFEIDVCVERGEQFSCSGDAVFD